MTNAQLRWRWVNRVAFWIVCALFAYQVLSSLARETDALGALLWLLLIGVVAVMIAHVTATILFLEWVAFLVVSRYRVRDGVRFWERVRACAPPLPFGPPRWRTSAATPWVVIALVVAPAIARETGRLQYSWYNSQSSSWTSHRWNEPVHNGTLVGDEQRLTAGTFDGAAVSCDVTCSPEDTSICDGFFEALDCPRTRPDADGPTIRFHGHVAFDGQPFCYTPIIKYGSTSVKPDLAVDARSGATSYAASAFMTVSHELTMTGFASCRQFRRLFGEQIGRQIVKILNGKLREM